MPQRARGTFYFGQVAAHLKCTENHGAMADELYSAIASGENGYGYGAATCKIALLP